MNDALLKQPCVPCEGDSPPVPQEQINALRVQIPDWNLIQEQGELHLQRCYQFRDFETALAFTQQVGQVAEQEGHHPALLTEWGKVTVTWWTHAIKGLHQNDFIMAAKTDVVARQFAQ